MSRIISIFTLLSNKLGCFDARYEALSAMTQNGSPSFDQDVPITLHISCFTVSKLNVPTYGRRDSLCSWLISPKCDSDFRSTWTEKTRVSNHHLNQKGGVFQNSKQLWLVRKYVTMKQQEGFSISFNFWRTLLFTEFPEYGGKISCVYVYMWGLLLGRIICLKWKLSRLQAMSVLQACPTHHVWQ